MLSQKEKPKALPYHYYFFSTLLLCLIGLADTLYLTVSHYKNYTDISYSSFCAISQAINCDTVSQSPWSILLGLPVAIWGFFGYGLFLLILCCVYRYEPKRLVLWRLMFAFGLIFSCSALYFGYISATKINSYCILCLLSYLISFSLLFVSWLVCRRFDCQSLPTGIKASFHFISNDHNYLKYSLATMICAIICLRIFIPQYWTYSFPAPTLVQTGTTENGYPWIGAEDPVITIEEYSDYQCFQCKKMHFMLRQLIAEHSDKIRLVHHHYPMDHTVNNIIVKQPFHVGSAKMAYLAIYAAYHDKFWQMNDALYQFAEKKEDFNTEVIAQKTGFKPGELAMALNNPTIKTILLHDVRKGLRLHLTATPSYVIDEHIYVGSIPPEILAEVIQ